MHFFPFRFWLTNHVRLLRWIPGGKTKTGKWVIISDVLLPLHESTF